MGNNLLSVWGTVGSVLLAILILLVMITIHEFGHYIAGKIFKFTIDEFSIGFGPALFKRRSKKTGELFAVRLIPLGGYCAFAGEDGLEEEEKDKKAEESEDEGRNAPPFEEMSEEKPAENPAEKPAENPAEKPEEEPRAPEAEGTRRDSAGYFTNRPCWQRIIVLVSGALMNYLLALFLIFICFTAYGQSVVRFDSVQPAENAEYNEYSLRAGDILLEADGHKIYLTTDLAQALNKKTQGSIVRFLVSRVDENGERATEEVDVMLRADVEVKNSTELAVVWKALGAGIVERDGTKYYDLTTDTYRFGFFEGIGRGFIYSFKIAGSIFRVLGELLTGKLGLSAFGGPVATITMTSKVVRQGFQSFLEIASYIGVNLAVFNLLPIPALDGSKVVFTAIEWVRGKPINRKVEAIIHVVGLVLLLGFAVLVDILQFV